MSILTQTRFITGTARIGLRALAVAVLWLTQAGLIAQTASTPTVQFPTVADMVAARIPATANRLTALVTGRNSTNDGGGGIFFYDSASAASTNLGTIFKPAGSNGRWLRQYSGAVNVKWFGAVGDGVTDDTASVQNALELAESEGGELNFPKASYSVKMVFIVTGNVRLDGMGSTIVQNHDNVNSITVGGAGQYKVSSAFFIKRGATDIEITDFDFTTNDASFPALAVNFGSYFASIGGQHFERVSIHGNRFRGGQKRCLFVQAGSHFAFSDNFIYNNGVTLHVGYELNIYFYDNASDTSIVYSPFAVSVEGNVFDGYSFTDPSTCLFLSGVVQFNVSNNKFLNMDEATVLRPLIIYSNDVGVYDSGGVALTHLDGVCVNNQISGTFKTGLEISGNSPSASSTWNTNRLMNVVVQGNLLDGTGSGIKLNDCNGTRISDNIVTVSGSPMVFQNQMSNLSVTGNRLESTLAGENQTTIFGDWNTNANDLNFTGNTVVTPSGGQYGFRSTVNVVGLTMADNVWDFNSDAASCRVIVLTVGGTTDVTGNRFYIDTDTASIFGAVFVGVAQSGTLNFSRNSTASLAGTGATTFSFFNASDFKEVRFLDNVTMGAVLIEDSLRCWVLNNTVVLPASNTNRGIYCDNTGYAQVALVEMHGNYVLQSAALNNPCLAIASNNDAANNTLSKVTMNRVEGNSNSVLIQQTVQGTIEYIGNTIINNGAGGTAIGVTGAAVGVAL